MDKIRISEIAKELGKTSKEVLQKAQELGFESKTASSSVTTEQAEILYNYILSGVNPATESKTKDSAKNTKAKKSTEEAKSKVPKRLKEKQKLQKKLPNLPRKKLQKQHQRSKRVPSKQFKNPTKKFNKMCKK